MPDNLTTTAEIDAGVEVFYERTLLETAEPYYPHARFAQSANLPKGKGKTIKWRRYNRLAAATTPLTEGVTPNGSKLSKVDILATVSQYGDFVHVTDVVDITTPDAEITIATERQSDQMHNTLDVLCKNVLAACASQTTCTSGSGPVTLLNKTDIDSVVQTLLGGLAKFITKFLRPGRGQGSAPVSASFWGILDNDLIDDIAKVEGWLPVKNYPTDSSKLPEEWGNTGNVRWLRTTEGYKSGDNYHLPILGADAYGIVNLAGGNAKSIRKPFGSGGTADPLDQRATVGWKNWQVVKILNDAFMHVLICTNG